MEFLTRKKTDVTLYFASLTKSDSEYLGKSVVTENVLRI